MHARTTIKKNESLLKKDEERTLKGRNKINVIL
jgi:hypothetical protein